MDLHSTDLPASTIGRAARISVLGFFLIAGALLTGPLIDSQTGGQFAADRTRASVEPTALR